MIDFGKLTRAVIALGRRKPFLTLLGSLDSVLRKKCTDPLGGQ